MRILAIFFLSLLVLPCFAGDNDNPYAVSPGVSVPNSGDWLADLEQISKLEGSIPNDQLVGQANAVVDSVAGFESKIDSAPQERLSQLSPYVTAAVLARASPKTLAKWRQAIPTGQETEAWSQLVNLAEVHRCTIESQRPPPKNWNGWATLGNLLIAGTAMTVLPQAGEPTVAVLGAAGALFTMMALQYGTAARDRRARRRHEADKRAAQEQLREAKNFARQHALPFYPKLANWDGEMGRLITCVDYFRAM